MDIVKSDKMMWIVRAGEKCYLYNRFKEEGIVAMGWDLGDLSEIESKEELNELIDKKYQNKTSIVIKSNRGSFLLDMEIEDKVVTYNIKTKKYLIGEITSNYLYNPDFEKGSNDYNDTRKVKWFGEVDKDKLSKDTLKKLGAPRTVYKVNEEAEKELLSLLNSN